MYSYLKHKSSPLQLSGYAYISNLVQNNFEANPLFTSIYHVLLLSGFVVHKLDEFQIEIN